MRNHIRFPRVQIRVRLTDQGESRTITNKPIGRAKGLHLLFATGKRPNRAAIREFVSAHRTLSLSHDPFDDTPVQLVSSNGEPIGDGVGAQVGVDDQLWVELLLDGLAFDLFGMAPGLASKNPEIGYRFDLDQSLGSMRLEGMHLVPGQHLAGGASSMPVMRALLSLARDFIHHFDALEAVVWEPAGSAIGRRYFESVITAWLDGGAFPALGLTAFRETHDGALESVGLDFWIGQELRIEPPLSTDRVEATRLGVRLINQLIIIGGLEESERVIAPDGNPLVMRPSRNRRYVRVARE